LSLLGRPFKAALKLEQEIWNSTDAATLAVLAGVFGIALAGYEYLEWRDRSDLWLTLAALGVVLALLAAGLYKQVQRTELLATEIQLLSGDLVDLPTEMQTELSNARSETARDVWDELYVEGLVTELWDQRQARKELARKKELDADQARIASIRTGHLDTSSYGASLQEALRANDGRAAAMRVMRDRGHTAWPGEGILPHIESVELEKTAARTD
jgi:hypothetical protein